MAADFEHAVERATQEAQGAATENKQATDASPGYEARDGSGAPGGA